MEQLGKVKNYIMDFFFFANDVDVELAANGTLTVSLALNLELFFFVQTGRVDLIS